MCTDSPTALINQIIAGSRSLQQIAEEVCPAAGLDIGTEGFTECRNYIASLGPHEPPGPPGCARIVTNKLQSGAVWYGGVTNSVVDCAKSQYPLKPAGPATPGTPADTTQQDKEKQINNQCDTNISPDYKPAHKQQCNEKAKADCMGLTFGTDEFNSCVLAARSAVFATYLDRLADFWGIVPQQCHYWLGERNTQLGDSCVVNSRPCGIKEAPKDKSDDDLKKDVVACIGEVAKSVGQTSTLLPQVRPAAPGTITPPQLAPTFNPDWLRHLHSFCSSANGVNPAKSTACNDKVGSLCDKKTTEEEFRLCVQKEAHARYGGIYNPAAPQGAPAAPPATAKPADNQALAIVNGFENIDQELPAYTTEITIAGKVFEKDDVNQKCLITDVQLVFGKTADEDGKLITPINSITPKTQNCQPYKVTLQGAGQYQLSVHDATKDSLATSSIVFTVAKAPAAKEVKPEVFVCLTMAKAVGNTIQAYAQSGTSPSSKNFLGYDRAQWFIKKGMPTNDDPLAFNQSYSKGSNCQFGGRGDPVCKDNPKNPDGGDITSFTDLEVGQRYTIQAVAYPKDDSKKSVICALADPIQITSKQVLGETSDDFSSATTQIGLAISSDGISNVVITSIGYDGQPVDTLYNGQVGGVQVIDVTVSNLTKVNRVEAVIVPLDDVSGTNSQTISLNLPNLTNLTPAPTRTQAIELSKSLGESFTQDDVIDLMAITNLPVADPSFVDSQTNQRFTVDSENRQEKCTATNEERCVYRVQLAGTLVRAGHYSIQFYQDRTPLTQAGTLDFDINPSSTPALAPAPVSLTKIKTKVTAARADGSDARIIALRNPETNLWERQPANPFTVNFGDNTFKYIITYNWDDNDTSDVYLEPVVREAVEGRVSTPEPAATPVPITQPGLQECPFADLCPDGSYRQCIGTIGPDDGQCHYSDEIGVSCERECNQLEQPASSDNCQQEIAEDLGDGMAQNYLVCDNGSKIPNGKPYPIQ